MISGCIGQVYSVCAAATDSSAEYPYISYGQNIIGSNIDGSTFNIETTVRDIATNGLTYYGTTTATVSFSVNWQGNVDVIVDDVEGTVKERGL